MGLFSHFPYSNIHQLNLDWIIEQIKTLKENAVISVNGQTGEVVLYQSENIQFPDVESGTWRMVRTAAGTVLGVMFQNGLMYVMDGNTADRVYTINHPPAYPVTSVDGQTGAVHVFPNAATRLPDVTDDYTNIRRQIKTGGTDNIVGIELKRDAAYRMKDSQRYEIYDKGNTPTIVTSVNGQTGPVMLAIPFDTPLTDSIWMGTEASEDHTAGIGRETVDGTVELYTVTTGTDAAAYIHFVSADDQYSYTRRLLTLDDIPSSSGVVSFNGQTGVVTLYGNTLPIESGSAIMTKDYIDADFLLINNTLAPGLDASMNPPVSIPAGEYCHINGVFYKNISGATLPANTPVSMASLQAVGSLGLVNELYSIEESIMAEIANINAGSIQGESNATATQVVTKNNYHALGIVGYNLSGTGGSNCGVQRVFLSNISGSSATININIRNYSTNDTGDITAAVRVLWLKS